VNAAPGSCSCSRYFPIINKTIAINSITAKIIKITFAMLALAADIPVKPNKPATSEIIKKNKTQRIIDHSLQSYELIANPLL
jgi:hypothetical protein